ncbi:MAG: MFS transporter [Pseudomonadota bacterium]
MIGVFRAMWALLIGMFLLQIGNGLQGTALGIRGGIEGFDTTVMGVVMSGYFVGFLAGAWITPKLLRRVGHVRTFAALASLISAACIIYGAAVDPIAWLAMRLVTGACFSGVYVVAESWLNNQSTNENRGQTLSVYLVCQMGGIVLAQAAVPLADPAGYDLFVIMTVAVSIACAPILLSASPAPVVEHNRQLSLVTLFRISPLGVVGTLVMGAVFASMFGMTAVWGTAIGLSAGEVSAIVGTLYIGAMVLQFPVGWLSDRMDRRILIIACTGIGAIGAVAMALVGTDFTLVLVAAFLVGGMANPLYSLLIAHTNDYMDWEDMAAAAGGLVLLNGLGAAGTPFVIGALMDVAGPVAFPVFMATCFSVITLYGLYRMTVRPATPVDETLPHTAIAPTLSMVTVSAAQEVYAEAAEAQAADSETGEDGDEELDNLDTVDSHNEHGWGDEGETRPAPAE